MRHQRVQPPAVELHGITKRFPGVVANKDIAITVRKGTVHALIGENGAGKSTLMKILYGMQKPDEGTIAVDGEQVTFSSPGDAIARGIGMVHQHFMLADNLTVLENVVLGGEKLHGIGAKARKKIREISDQYGLGVRPDVLVEDLGVADRQRVEILKVLYRGARILILDEPTAVLVPQEVDALFDNLRELKSEGLTVIFISHKLGEVLKVADDITVIRRGTTVGTADPRTATTKQLAELMVGSELPSPETRESTVTDVPMLQVRNLTLSEAGAVAAVPLTSAAPPDPARATTVLEEPVGAASSSTTSPSPSTRARSSASRASRATARPSSSRLSWAWPPPTRAPSPSTAGTSPRSPCASAARAASATSPRTGTATACSWRPPLGEPHPRPRHRGPQLQARRPRPEGRPQGHRADRPRVRRAHPGIDVTAASLSGGNQQKLIVGREMSHAPKFLIAAHPTRGVDVGAQAQIWDAIRDARREGLAVLLISADLDELIGLSDTLRVMYRGKLVADADPATITPEELGSAMTGAATGRLEGTEEHPGNGDAR